MRTLTVDEAVAVVRDAIGDVAPEVVDELESIDGRTDLWEALELDSMDHQNVMVRLFDRTGVDIPERDYGRLRSLSALAAHLVASTG